MYPAPHTYMCMFMYVPAIYTQSLKRKRFSEAEIYKRKVIREKVKDTLSTEKKTEDSSKKKKENTMTTHKKNLDHAIEQEKEF